MDDRDARKLHADADHAAVVRDLAAESVDNLERKVDKCRQDLEDAKAALVEAKEVLKDAEDDAESKSKKTDGVSVTVNARAAEIKAIQ